MFSGRRGIFPVVDRDGASTLSGWQSIKMVRSSLNGLESCHRRGDTWLS
jgi:hypothetical protein